MNTRKIAGRVLIGTGSLLMMIGTATVPSSSWAGAVGAECTANCNFCGDAEHQGTGIYLCLWTVDGVPSDGYCRKTGAECKKCHGSCKDVRVGNGRKCKCEELTRDIVPVEESLE